MSDPRDDRDRDERDERSADDRDDAPEERGDVPEETEPSSDEGGEDWDRAEPGSGDVDPEAGEEPLPREDSPRDEPLGPEGELDDEPGSYEGVGEEIGAAGGPDRAQGEASGSGGIDAPGEEGRETRDYEGTNEKVDEPADPGGTTGGAGTTADTTGDTGETTGTTGGAGGTTTGGGATDTGGGTADRTGAGRSGAESNRGGGPTAGRRDESNRIATGERRENVPLVAGVVTVVGAWVAVSAFLLDGTGEAGLWNNVVVGAAILLLAGYNYYRLYDDDPASVGIASLVALLGLWLVAAPIVLGMEGGAFWSTVASGAIVAGLAGYNAYEARSVAAGERRAGAG